MKKQHVFHALILGIVAIALYGKSILYGFSYFDDHLLILRNADYFFDRFSFLHYLFGSSNLGAPDAFYRPLQNFSFFADAQLGGMAAWPFHLHSILLFAAIGIALYDLLRQLTLPTRWAWGAALLYIVHPLFVSAVGWIPARGDLQLALLLFVSFSFFVRYTRTRKAKHAVVCLMTWFFALLAKETAVVLPLIWLAYAYEFLKRPLRAESSAKKDDRLALLKPFSGLMIGTLLALLVWFIFRWMSVDSHGLRWEVVGSNLQHYPAFFQQIMLPYDGNPVPLFHWTQLGVGLMLLLLLCGLYLRIKPSDPNRSLFRLGLVIVTLGIFPVLWSQIPLLYHRFLFPALGFILMGYALVPERMRTQAYLKYVGLFLGVVFCAISLLRLPDYQDYESFYGKVIAHSDRDLEQYYLGRGIARQEHKNLIGALEDYDAAIKIDPKFEKPYVLRGVLRAEFKDVEGGISDLTQALEIGGPQADLYYNRAGYYALLGKTDLAIADYDAALSLNPNLSLAYNNRANLLLALGHYERALTDYTAAISLDPGYATAYVNRALTQYHLKNIPAALADISIALQKVRDANEKAVLYFRQAQLYYQTEKYYDALNAVNSYLRMNGEDAGALELREDIRKKIQ